MKTLYFEIDYGQDHQKKQNINIQTVLSDLKFVFCVVLYSMPSRCYPSYLFDLYICLVHV
jgi:hypothetical protein